MGECIGRRTCYQGGGDEVLPPLKIYERAGQGGIGQGLGRGDLEGRGFGDKNLDSIGRLTGLRRREGEAPCGYLDCGDGRLGHRPRRGWCGVSGAMVRGWSASPRLLATWNKPCGFRG
ncbi:hypothetical protein NDU88_000892 [Pleurodeles waltl]|uniref:Uncharacterized protein n=1 Tax=Pleurodeles waltl TaxID=8319 RepID=A0AAV7L9Q9_PLEWA|nr:hypothetical protein NDU88_000892 [Pleurodeles waltl]